jgi:ferric-dicitrate binding protein FerR (iron transport regulator)
MKKRHFFEILTKYRLGKATEEEREFIDSYYNLFEVEPGLEAWLNDEESEQMTKKMLRGVWQKIMEEEAKDGEERKIKRFPTPMKIAAAVLILIASAVAFYGIAVRSGSFEKGAVGSLTEVNPQQQIHPGGNKAVLTLANGRQIVLDNSEHGSLAQQGVAKISVVGSGQLVYSKKQGTNGKRHRETVYNTITTPRGGQYEIVLSDGSRVWLNAASSLHFPAAFTGNSRTVQLNGEAYFEIAKQPEKPFIVEAGHAHIQVLGTDFNVSAYRDEEAVKTTLTEGAVRVTSFATGNSSGGVTLKPGEQASVDKQTGNMEVEAVNVDLALAWKNGLFYFQNTNITTIMEDVARWYNVEVVYETQDLKSKNFSGVLSRYGQVDALLKRLELTGAVNFRIDGNKIIVTD